MELTKDISKTQKSDNTLNEISPMSRKKPNSKTKLVLKNNNLKNYNTNDSEKITILSFQNNKINKKVKFKEENFVQIIEIESFKKHNIHNSFNENIKSLGHCDCFIL